ncbi:acyl-CoA dehydrogenase family protein [Marmoricola sp. RAF53]|uniref:acyl-CoA dehydrogenase family protein n=1 Tax=Marmoricola sp. RAF53 TaxID=3233059 RepID=UPI003F96D4EC
MHFARTEEQDELAATIADLLGKRSGSEAVRAASVSEAGYDAALWSALCEQIGVAALPVPEQYDGIGVSLVETAVVLEELGEALTPAPLLATTLATCAVLLFADEDAKADLLPRLAAGEIGTVALDSVAGDLVLDAVAADIVLAVDGDELRLLDSPVVETVGAMDQTLRFGRIAGGAGRAAGTRIGTVTDPRVLPAISTALATALQVGTMQRALDMTVGYSLERVQFGRQIGSFQALKHRMADMLVLLEASRSASWGATAVAAAYLEGSGDERSAEEADRLVRLAAVAGSYCSEALDHLASEMVQLHGGIAITWEHDAHLVFKRAHALSQLNGPAHRQRATLLG